MGAIRATQCRVCGAPREEGSHDVLCKLHRQERDRLQRRRQRGVPMDLPAPKPREFPRGQCVVCGGEVYNSGRCKDHSREYKREWAAQQRRRLGMTQRTRRTVGPPAEPRAAKPPKPVLSRPKVADVPCFVGPEFIPTVKPVDVSGYDLTRWKSPGIVAEEEEREREWSEWFAARGL